jgi:ferredoxin-nitrite reductase
VRLRIPGGLLSSQQCRVLAAVSDRLGVGAIDITNRANVQIRGLTGALPNPLLVQLQAAGLAASLREVDHLRNIMASPTAGIDLTQLIDTRPVVRQLDEYLSSHADLVQLSPKFSIGLDGGEQASIRQQPNDIQFTAVEVGQDAAVPAGVYFCLSLAGIDLAKKAVSYFHGTARYFLLQPEDCVTVVAALAQAYLEQDRSPTRKPRLKQVLAAIDLEGYLVRQIGCVQVLRDVQMRDRSRPSHLGIHPQRGGSYIGVALPLGRLQSDQLRHLADLAETYGSGSLRLSPWRNLLLPDLADADLPAVQQALAQFDLSSHSIWGGLIACSGTIGCASSATDTQADAQALARLLEQTLTLDQPIAIHFSGCPKSCAHHGSSDLTLIGIAIEREGELLAGYDLYVGDRLVATGLPDQLLPGIVRLISIYQQQRSQPSESFREFVDRCPASSSHLLNGGKT